MIPFRYSISCSLSLFLAKWTIRYIPNRGRPNVYNRVEYLPHTHTHTHILALQRRTLNHMRTVQYVCKWIPSHWIDWNAIMIISAQFSGKLNTITFYIKNVKVIFDLYAANRNHMWTLSIYHQINSKVPIGNIPFHSSIFSNQCHLSQLQWWFRLTHFRAMLA